MSDRVIANDVRKMWAECGVSEDNINQCMNFTGLESEQIKTIRTTKGEKQYGKDYFKRLFRRKKHSN